MTQTTVRATIQRKSARLCRVVTLLVVALAVTLVLERFGALASAFLRGQPDGTAQRLAVQFVRASPEVLYLLGLWWIRAALAALAEGDLYAATLTRMIDRVGAMLATGALVGVFIVPTASRLVGVDPGYVIAFDVSGLVLGAVGLSLKVFAHLFQHASAMQAELQEIF